MAYKCTGTASKSASGASMSKYDVEVEERLRKLEAAVAALQTHQHEAAPVVAPAGDDARITDILERLDRHQLR